jgi:PAS domain S-box-containing protein
VRTLARLSRKSRGSERIHHSCSRAGRGPSLTRVPVLGGAASFEGENQGVAFVPDLTERKRMEQALRQSEAYLAEAQRLTHTGSWAFNPGTGEVTYWSDEMFRICGLDVRDSPPTYDEQVRFTHPEDRVRSREAFEIAIRDKVEMVLDYRKVMADGTVRYLHSVGHPVLDKTGALVEYFGTVLDVTERRCAERRLLAQHRVARILAEADTEGGELLAFRRHGRVGEATPKILQAVCECMEWHVGVLWCIDREACALRCAEVWCKPSVEAAQFEAVTRTSTFRLGIGLPGRVWASGTPAYISDVVHTTECYADIAAREGLHAAFALPILLGSEVLGVMGFFSRDVWQADQKLLDMMATIGSQIAQFTKRVAAVDELQLRVSMLQHIPVAAWSDRFATPFGFLSVFESRRIFGVSMPLRASTKVFPVTRVEDLSGA